MLDKIRDLWHQALASVLAELTEEELRWLLCSRWQVSLLEKRRTTVIVSRVRIVAALFALLTPLWIVVDIAAFEWEVWYPLVLARLAATFAFAMIALHAKQMNSMNDAYRILTMLFLVPTAFFLFSYQHMAQFELHGLQQAFSTGYAFLPFVMLAGLSIFPLTLVENIAFISPLFIMQAIAGIFRLPVLDWPTFTASFWLMALIAGVAVLAGLSQLAFIIVMVRESVRDRMTGCFSRASGEELIELQFNLVRRSGEPLTIAFIDLDHFKEINDTFGHEAGDVVLATAARAIQNQLRQGDILVRWGGEEFLLILPNTTLPQARHALERVRAAGLGKRPDGRPITASIGLAERREEPSDYWPALVEIADRRMYRAKQAGRNRIVSEDAPAAE
ncbi:MAG: GGDEF domain-containing protein [Rhodocyclaceae bacterium]|nr:GGDEF domain-containing protein [Rhodocyclaceae bacterium]